MDEEPSRYSVERGLGLEVGWFLCLVKQREREKAMTEPDQIRHSLVTQRGYQVISLSWLGNNYRAVRSCRFFMKFRGENIFSHSFTRNERNVCSLFSDRETNRDSFIPVSFFFFYLVSSTRVLCLFVQSDIFGVLSNKQEERLRWIFWGGKKSGRESRVIISYTGFLSFHFWKRSVHRAWDVIFVYIYICIRVWLDPRIYTRFRWSSSVFLASIVYCISTIRIFQRLCCINDVEVFLVVERIVDNREYTLIL